MSVNKLLFKKAFSLIELLIVIVIIGVVYTLAVQGIYKMNDKAALLSFVSLKEYLVDREYEKNVKMLCLDDCSECSIYVDDSNKSVEKLENFIDSKVKVYRYDPLYGYREKEKAVYFNENGVDEDICFSYEINKEGVGDQVLVEYKESFYDMSSYFTKTTKYSSMDVVRESKENLLSDVTQ